VKRRPLASVSTPAVGRSRAWALVNEHLQAGEGALIVHVILVPRYDNKKQAWITVCEEEKKMVAEVML